MRRRDLLILGGASVGLPRMARAQGASAQKRVGVLSTVAKDDPLEQQDLAALRQGLAEWGWHELKI